MRSQGHTVQAVADALNVNKRTIRRWLRHGTPQHATIRPSQIRLSAASELSIISFFVNNNTATLKQAAQYLSDEQGVTVCLATIWNCCRKQKLTWKKGSKAYSEMDEDRAQQFVQDIKIGFNSRVMALDEAAFFWNHTRGYAWGAKGERAIIRRPGIRGRAHSLLLCISSDGVVNGSFMREL